MIKRFFKLSVLAIILSKVSLAFGQCQSNQTISVTRDALLIDGKATTLKAVSYSISYPGAKNRSEVPISAIDKDFKDIKAAGFNAVRSYEPWPSEIIDLLEAHGLYLIEGVVHIDDSINFDSEDELQETINSAVSVVKLHRNRKSLLFWSLWNDAPFNWGTSGGNVVSRFGEATVANFMKRLYDAVKAVDDRHPITASNVANAKFFEVGMNVVDVIGINAYLGISDWVTQSYSPRLGDALVLRLKGLSAKYGKPVWISEVGCASISHANNQGDVIPQQIRLLRRGGFIGFSIFQWHDDWSKAGGLTEASSHIEACWGLRDAFRKPKPGFEKVVAAILEPAGTTVDHYDKGAEWVAAPNMPLEDSKDAKVLDDFSYLDNNSLRQAYSEKSTGYSHAFLSLSKNASDRKQALKIRFVPEDFGSWLLTSREPSAPIDIGSYKTIAIRLRSIGAPANFSIVIKLRDGRVFRSVPLPLSISETTTYQLPTSSLFLDWLSNSESVISASAKLPPLGTIARFGFRINDVAYFEALGSTSEIFIERVEFLK